MSRTRVQGCTQEICSDAAPLEIKNQEGFPDGAPEIDAALRASVESGHEPDKEAVAHEEEQSGLVGLWMNLDYSPYRAQVLDRMRAAIRRTKLTLVISDVGPNANMERPLLVPVDGIISFDNSIEAFGPLEDYVSPYMPFVSMGAYWSDARSYVGVDLRLGAEIAMDHLLDTGLRRIAFAAPESSRLRSEGPRFEAYMAKMRDACLAPEILAIEEVSADGVARSLDWGRLPEAIFCLNDDLALSLEFALLSRGIAVGPELAIVGFDGVEETGFAPCPITTVSQPIEAMCLTAVKFLEDQILNPSDRISRTILKPQLIVRESSAFSR